MPSERPWFQFYARDWLDNKELARCTPTARAVLLDLMCLAHEGTPYGHLSDQVGALLDSYLASKCRISVKRFLKAIDELKEFKRISATADGILYVPRMVRDEALRVVRAEGGWKSRGNKDTGENYNLPGFLYLMRRDSDSAIKIGISLDPKSRLWKTRSNVQGDQIVLLATFPVNNMGTVEKALHVRFESKRVIGEWFALDANDIASISTLVASFPCESSHPSTLPSGEIDSCARVHARSDSDFSSPSVSENGFKKLITEEKSFTRARTENGATKPNPLAARYREFIKLWSEPTEDGRIFNCADVDLGNHVWISLIDSGAINAENIEQVFAGLRRYKQSERWRAGYVLSVPSFLGWAKNGTPAAPRWNDLPKPAVEEY